MWPFLEITKLHYEKAAQEVIDYFMVDYNKLKRVLEAEAKREGD